jgi:hypothetical protein
MLLCVYTVGGGGGRRETVRCCYVLVNDIHSEMSVWSILKLLVTNASGGNGRRRNCQRLAANNVFRISLTRWLPRPYQKGDSSWAPPLRQRSTPQQLQERGSVVVN